MKIKSDTIRKIKRGQMIRSYESLVKEYPDAKTMSREEAVDYLISLEGSGKINISFETKNSIISCKIHWFN
ncbi:hypothetical protein MNBD_GAMMA04-2151 [hydrothermal vent metagenome]|uniref:Uncharacterized protein n=1 Tax=hydrothermal vent metagenome TaxID=652676 RepID=A0A3B0WKI0_9ZZZZ